MADYGLEFSEIYGRVQDYANITNITGSSTKAKKAVNDALRKIAASRRWLALRRTGEITPVASTQSYVLTSLTGFNYPVRCYYISNGIEQDIRIVSEEEWAQKVDDDSDGTPEICAFLDISGATKVYFSLRPSAAFIAQHSTIYIDYDKKPTELSSNTDVPEIPNTNNQMALVYYAVSELLLKQGDYQGSTAYFAKAEDEMNKTFISDIHFRGMKRKAGKPSFGVLHGVNRQRTQKDYK
jgi:hypothetical protein